MDKDEALKLALEALEQLDGIDTETECVTIDVGDVMDAVKQALAAPVQDLPFGVGGGLVAIKTLLSRDPCVHANTAIEMIDAILKEHPAAQRPWVGLTDDEIIKCTPNWIGTLEDVARAVEAKLKEKNT